MSGSERSAAAPAHDDGSSPTWLGRSGRLRLQRRCACGGATGLSGDCESCTQTALAPQRGSLQRRDVGQSVGISGLPASVGRTLGATGHPLDSGTRRFMESRFGTDFSPVRVHTGPDAAASARDVQALAYTVGQDIVFGSGQYQPHTGSGRHLIAHELAHTVQQQGLQRSGTPALVDQGPEYRQLEVDADRAADAAVRGLPVRALAAASGPLLSRTPPDGRIAASGTAASGTTKEVEVETHYATTMHHVTPEGGYTVAGAAVQSFTVDKLYVPVTKGPRALAFYRAAAGGALQATLSVTDSIRSQQWQSRDDTAGLRDRWLQLLGWQAGADANARWQAAGGDSEFPRVGGATCQMDHIIELQISGNNTNENIQALDAEQNRNSGGAIKTQVFGLAAEIQRDRELTDGNAQQLQLRFGDVEWVETGGISAPEPLGTGCPPTPRTCLAVEACARAGAGGAVAADPAAAALEDHAVSAGGTATTLRVPSGFGAARTAPPVPILGDPANDSAAELISGLLLVDVARPAAGEGRIRARLDDRSATRVPLTMTGDTAPIELDVHAAAPGGARPLRLRNARPNVTFTYPYLSPGRITQMSLSARGGVNWRGEITTSVPFLRPPLEVIYEDGSLRLAVELTRERLRSPVPGFTLTEASLSLTLSPVLQGNGHLGFALGSATRPLATGTMDVTADASGLSASGVLRANIPGVDTAEGSVSWRNGVTSGQIVVESSQIRLPNVERARLQIDIDNTGLHPSGEVELLLPRDLGRATLGLSLERRRFVYTGRGRLRVPGLEEVDIRARFDGVRLHAEANNVAFRWHGLDGRINVAYDARGDEPGRVSGSGQLRLRRGDVTGTIDVTLHNSGRFSGQGRLTYPFTIRGQRIEASAGVSVGEDQQVRVLGAVRFPQPIELFGRFGDSRPLFRFQHSIPIPGLSIGPVGVVAVIQGGVSARYGFGPGQLRNVALEAAFNPLAEHIDPDVSFHAELHIPAEAAIAGTIGGGLGVEAGLGRVNGTLTVTADLGLNAALGSPLDLRYQNRQFEITARPGIDAALNLGLSLDAHARAEAGIGMFSIGIDKSWNLGRRNLVLGRFSMYAPIGWSSEGGFSPPTMDQIEWGPMPEVDPADLLAQLFRSSSAEERPT